MKEIKGLPGVTLSEARAASVIRKIRQVLVQNIGLAPVGKALRN